MSTTPALITRNGLAAGPRSAPGRLSLADCLGTLRSLYTPDPPAPLPRVDLDAAARQVAGTSYTAEQQARVARPTGGKAARDALKADPDGALAELIDLVVECGTLADWCRRRGLAYTTAQRWIASDAQRAKAYEDARDDRLMRQADEIVKIADESTASTRAELRHVELRMQTRMTIAERLMPGRFGRRLTVRHVQERAARCKSTDAQLLAVVNR